MEWKEWPSGPGIYWKRNKQGQVECVQVEKRNFKAVYFQFEYLSDISIKLGECEWYGPLEPPAST